MPEQPVITTKKSLLNRELTDQVATVIYNFFWCLNFYHGYFDCFFIMDHYSQAQVQGDQ
jgi:hypothetical protein